MDSSNWSAERKIAAGAAFARRVARLGTDPVYRNKRKLATVAAHLAVVVAKSGFNRARVAERAGIKPAQLSRQLGGSTNLTLESIGRICAAVGWDFDVVFRGAGQQSAAQPWETPAINRATIFHLVSSTHRPIAATLQGNSFGWNPHILAPSLDAEAANGCLAAPTAELDAA